MPESEGYGGEHQIGGPACPRAAECVSYAREIPCALCPAPSPRGDAPSPLAFAKSCKGGDVSVLDPALAWDVRFIYLFTDTQNDICIGRADKFSGWEPLSEPSKPLLLLFERAASLR